MASVSVVVPVYNGEASLDELVRRIAATLEQAGLPFEVVLVNDGSRDRSWEAILHLTQGDARVRGIDLARNFGQHNALLAGIRTARHDVVVTLDDDLQHPPEAIPALLAKLEEGYDVVYGAPREVRHPWTRRLVSALDHFVLSRVLGAEIARDTSSYRAFRRRVRDAFADYEGDAVTLDALLTWGAGRFARVTVDHSERRYGRSNYTPLRLVRHAYDTITNFSVRPLKIAGVLGLVITLLGFAGTAYAVGFYKLQGQVIPPDVAIFAVVCLFSGIQLLILGVIGEYLARMHVRIMKTPPYAVRHDTEWDRSGEEPG